MDSDSESDSEDAPTIVHRTLERVGRYSAEAPRVIIAATVLLMVVAGGTAALNVKANIGTELYLEDSSVEKHKMERLNEEFDRGNQVFVMVEGDSIKDPETIRTIEQLDANYSSREEFSSVRSLADVVKAGNNGSIPDTKAGVNRSIQRVREQSNSTGVLVDALHPQDGMAMVIISYGDVTVPEGAASLYGFMPKKEADIVTETVETETNDVTISEDTEVTITGESVYQRAAFGQVFTEIVKLLTVGFTLVLVVVFFTMRGRLSRSWTAILPIVSTVVALVLMMGSMGVLGYQFNSIMLAILPISLGLGVDYGLQIKSRYLEEREQGRTIADAAGVAARTTGHTLILAMSTTAIGLGSLLVSSVPPTRQFGVTATISVMLSMGLSVTFLIALLSYFDVQGSRAESDSTTGITPSESTARVVSGIPEKIAKGLTRGVTASPAIILVFVLLIVGAGAVAYPQVDTKEDMQKYWPQDLEAREDIEQLQSVVSTPDRMHVIVDTDEPYTPSTFDNISSSQNDIRDIEEVKAVVSPVTAVKMGNRGTIPNSETKIEQIQERQAQSELLRVEAQDEHPNALVLTVYLEDVQGAETMVIRDEIRENVAESTSAQAVTVTGTPVLNRVTVNKVTSGRNAMTILSFTLGFLFLVLVFRSLKPAATIVGTVPAAAALIVAGGMYVFDVPWNPGTVMMTSIVLGIGLDYGLHVYERLQEELSHESVTYEMALEATLQKLSRPIIGSGLTTMIGFGVQMISDFPIVANFGKTLFISMWAILFATFIILPTALTLVGPPESEPQSVTA